MIIIADSGSTKTTWTFIKKTGEIVNQVKTKGINPFYQSKEEISHIIKEEISFKVNTPVEVHFYGAGCANEEKNSLVKNAITQVWNTSQINVESDLLAAARSLCKHRPGIACIMGTGSNSCVYDGKTIINHVSPLGYILGDEGSGAVLGKKLVADILKQQLPNEIIKEFENTYSYSAAEILDRVYKQPFPNRFLAQFTYFLSKNRDHNKIKNLIVSSFIEFFKRNIDQYENAKHQPVHFTGSIAWYFKDLLEEAAKECGYQIEEISKDPMNGLIEYHTN
ncbi:ATPase [Marinilabiliaceae bacterium ANBcel2]|nr:ATPase [Marinilabiliaceae bacterium ANBcel2]